MRWCVDPLDAGCDSRFPIRTSVALTETQRCWTFNWLLSAAYSHRLTHYEEIKMYTVSSVPTLPAAGQRVMCLGTVIESAIGTVEYSSALQASTGSLMPMPEGPGGPGSRARRTRGWGGCPVAY